MALERQGVSLDHAKKPDADGLVARSRVNSAGLPRVSLDLVLYWGSLGLSALAVVLFLWLMRDRRSRDE